MIKFLNLIRRDISNKKKNAVFTIVKNEKICLPIWLKYYSKQFEGEDIYVLDHESTDGSVNECLKDYNFNHIIVKNKFAFDHQWLLDTVKKMQKKLLKSYNYVLFTECDEIIIPNLQKYFDLKDYINKFNKACVKCKGYNIRHLIDEEDPLDLKIPILRQRNYWEDCVWSDKPLLSNKKLNWCMGFHSAPNCSNQDLDLMLIHLHFMDLDLLLDKHLARSKLNWNPKDIKKGSGGHNRIHDKKDIIKRWFISDKSKYKSIDPILKRSEII